MFFPPEPRTPRSPRPPASRGTIPQILFVIKEPDVFKTSSDNAKAPATYVVFGKAEIEDLSAQATSAAAEQFKAPGSDYTPPTFGGDDVTEVTAEGDDDGDEDAGDLDEND